MTSLFLGKPPRGAPWGGLRRTVDRGAAEPMDSVSVPLHSAQWHTGLWSRVVIGRLSAQPVPDLRVIYPPSQHL